MSVLPVFFNHNLILEHHRSSFFLFCFINRNCLVDFLRLVVLMGRTMHGLNEGCFFLL